MRFHVRCEGRCFSGGRGVAKSLPVLARASAESRAAAITGRARLRPSRTTARTEPRPPSYRRGSTRAEPRRPDLRRSSARAEPRRPDLRRSSARAEPRPPGFRRSSARAEPRPPGFRRSLALIEPRPPVLRRSVIWLSPRRLRFASPPTFRGAAWRRGFGAGKPAAHKKTPPASRWWSSGCSRNSIDKRRRRSIKDR